MVHVITERWSEQSYAGSTRSREGASFLSQVKGRPDGHRQEATRPMSQAHEEAAYKPTSPKQITPSSLMTGLFIR